MRRLRRLRRRVAAAALVLVLLAGSAPSAAAQVEGALLTDAAGDVQVGVQDQALPAPAPAGTYAGADLRSLQVIEGERDLTFIVEVEDLPSPDQDALGFGFETFFSHEGRQFRMVLGSNLPALSDGWLLALYAQDEGQEGWSQLLFDWQGGVADYDGDTVTATVPRLLLADALGAPPFPGRVLAGFRVASWANPSRTMVVEPLMTPVHVTDAMPDGGEPGPGYAIVLGPQQTGNARLTSAQPFRASNGEAGTFILDVTAHNLAEGADRFTLRPTRAMPGAELRVPEPEFEVAGGESRPFQVLLSVPFAHEHGQVRSVVLEMQSASDAGSTGRLELGVLYLPVPQPAGHHDTVYLHTGDDPTPVKAVTEAVPGVYGVDIWMNTLADDPADGGLGSPPSMNTIVNPDQASWEWWISLSGGLQLGLDFDLARLGRISVPFSSTMPVLGATMSGELVVYRWEGQQMGERLVVATIESSESVDLTDGEPRTLSGELVLAPAADLVPFRDGNELELVVRLEGMAPVAMPSPVIVSGGSMTLPLLEYQDPLDPMLASAEVVAAADAATGARDGTTKGSPGLAPVLLVLSLLAVAVVRRRKA